MPWDVFHVGPSIRQVSSGGRVLVRTNTSTARRTSRHPTCLQMLIHSPRISPRMPSGPRSYSRRHYCCRDRSRSNLALSAASAAPLCAFRLHNVQQRTSRTGQRDDEEDQEQSGQQLASLYEERRPVHPCWRLSVVRHEHSSGDAICTLTSTRPCVFHHLVQLQCWNTLPLPSTTCVMLVRQSMRCVSLAAETSSSEPATSAEAVATAGTPPSYSVCVCSAQCPRCAHSDMIETADLV